ncbi:MAG: hypothetical protein ABIH20_06585 [Candidatus Diapherotrites archaeon]
MNITINPLGLGTKSKTTKDQIMHILGNEWPLSAKEIFNKIHKEFTSDISYQAIHKTTIELENEGMVGKIDNKYSIKLDWVKNSKRMLDDLEERITKNNEGEKKIRVINCKSYHEFGRTLLELFADEVDNKTYKDPVSFHNHMWWIFTLQKDEYYWFKKTGETKCIMACKGNTLVDKFTSMAYKTIGHKVKLGVDYESNCDIVVSDNRVYQIYFPEKIKSMVKKATTEVKDSIDAFTKNYPEQMFEEKGTIKIIITKDRELANHLKKEIKTAWEAAK